MRARSGQSQSSQPARCRAAMRSSSGGCDMNSRPSRPRGRPRYRMRASPPATVPAASSAAGSAARQSSSRARRAWRRRRPRGTRAAARTTSRSCVARMPSRICATRLAMKKPGPVPRSLRSSTRSTTKPTTRDRNTTNVFSDALEQRERHHVAVRDVADLVAEHGFDLAFRELRQQARADGHERVVAASGPSRTHSRRANRRSRPRAAGCLPRRPGGAPCSRASSRWRCAACR